MAALKQPPSAQSVDQIRTKARRRLIGSIILVVLAVAILPWMFESQPRDSVVDIPIEIAGQPFNEGTVVVATLPPDLSRPTDPQAGVNGVGGIEGTGEVIDGMQAAQPDGTGYVSPFGDPVDSGVPVAEEGALHDEGQGGTDLALSGGYATRPTDKPVITAKAAAPVVVVATAGSAPVAPASASTPSVAPPPSDAQVAADAARAANAANAARAAALLGEDPAQIVRAQPTRPATISTPAATNTPPAAARPSEANRKFVVQVGAYADEGKANEVRARLTMAGHASFVQEVQTEAGKRIRVRLGPFDGRQAADEMATKIRSMGLDASVLPT